MTATTSDHDAGETPSRAVEIREVAARMFRQKGYNSTSIQDIADEVGLLKGSLYYHIDSKEDLLLEVIRRAHERGLEDTRRWAESDAEPAEKLRMAIRIHVTSNLSRLDEVGVFFHDFRSLSDDRREEIIKDRDYFDAVLRDVVREGQGSGAFDPDADPKMVVMALLGMINWTYQWYSPQGQLDPDAIADAFADIVLRGLARRP